MKPGRWAFSELAILALLLAGLGLPAKADGQQAAEPRDAAVIVSGDTVPPAPNDARWQPARLPNARAASVAWYRVEFSHPSRVREPLWVVYLPYFYGGGQVWLNGQLVASVPESTPARHVRWERPMLLALPAPTLRDGLNVLHLRAVRSRLSASVGAPRLAIGPHDVLQPQFDRRLFWVRTVPFVTVATGIAVGLFVLFIWWKRRSEVLYGLFGLAALLWAIRTNTFVLDELPAAWWNAWRLAYHASTGGFIVVMALFSLALAGWLRRRVAIGLAAYWALGPLVFLLGGARGDELVGRFWILGMIPVGLGMVAVTLAAAWRQRTFGTTAMAAGVAIAVATGLHDYVLAWRLPVPQPLGAWFDHRIFLMHHGANLLLVVMGALLTARLLRSLGEVEEMNRTLEARVAQREREIADSYERISTLLREQAAVEERQRIMQDLHDGLGSQLFTALLQVERGSATPTGIAEVLRGCIADMRIAIEALSGDGQDFGASLGNLLFRWEARLRDAGTAVSWRIDAPDPALAVPPHATLQLLRVTQEALTNVLKHAHASHVRIEVTHADQALRLAIEDDGRGFATGSPSRGRGLANMRSRARRIGAELQQRSVPGCTRIEIVLPQGAVPAPPAAPAETAGLSHAEALP